MTQCHRFTKDAGWNGAQCWSMNEIYDYLPKDEILRVEKIEFLDERELVKQLFEHYCISFAWINGTNAQGGKQEESRSISVDKYSTNDLLNFDDLEIW